MSAVVGTGAALPDGDARLRATRERAKRLVAEAEAGDADVVALAEVVSLAITVDPRLLRAAHQRFVDWRGPDLEADLWHSRLVASSNPTGLVLDAAVADELRIRLRRRDLSPYEEAWRLVEQEHDWLPGTLRLEERLRYLSLVPGGARQARLLLAELAGLVGDGTHEGLRPWIEGMVTRLPDPLRAQVDLAHLGLAPAPPKSAPRAPARTVGVRLLDGAVELGPIALGRATRRLPLPAGPPLVHLGQQLLDLDNLPQVHPVVPGRAVGLETLDGARLTLRGRRRQGQARPTALRGHRGPVWGVAFSPDGATVASAGRDGTVRLWEASTGAALGVLAGRRSSVFDVAFSPDGATVASAGRDGTVRLWEAATGAGRGVLKGHDGLVQGVAFSPEGATVASASRDGTVRLWEAATGAVRGVLEGHDGWVLGVAFSRDGATVASAGRDGTVRLWEATTGAGRGVLQGHRDLVFGVAFSPDGATVASGGGDGTVRLWEVVTGAARVLEGHDRSVLGVAFSPDGATVASAGGDGTVRLWEAVTGAVRRVLAGHDGPVGDVAFSPDGATVASVGDDGTVRLWEAATGAVRGVLAGHDGVVVGVAFSPDGATVASVGNDGTVRLWEAATGAAREVLEGHIGVVVRVAFSPDGATVASGGSDGTVRLWDSPQPVAVLLSAISVGCPSVAAVAAELAYRNPVRWTPAIGAGAGAVVAALLAVSTPDDVVRRLIAHGLAGRRSWPRRRAPGIDRWVFTHLRRLGMETCGDLPAWGPAPVHRHRFHAAVVDVATDRVVLLPLDAPRLGIDPASIPIASLLAAAVADGERTPAVEIGGRRFTSALGRRIDARAWLGPHAVDRPAVLIHVDDGSPAPRWPSGPAALVVTIPAPEPRGRRLTRPQRAAQALVGANVARRATDRGRLPFRPPRVSTTRTPTEPVPGAGSSSG